MKIKNITNSTRQCWDRQTGEKLLVEPNKIVERNKILFDKSSFIILNDLVENDEKVIPKLLEKKQIKRRNK
jgi:hypothetical protein